MTKRSAVLMGARDLEVPRQGLRVESLEYLRAGRQVSTALPVTICFYPDGSRGFQDGRHRVLVARERGEDFVRGRIIGMGPRGGIRWSYTGKVLI